MRLLLALTFFAGAASAQSLHKVQETSQRGSGPKGEDTSTQGPGVESGTGNAMAGGRTDFGPTGATGLVGSGAAHELALARANDQARGANPKGSFLRPADSPAQLELNPAVMGSGADYGAFPMGGQNYFDGHSQHRIASSPGTPGGSATKGSSGKSEE
jgi:hypothetical protein